MVGAAPKVITIVVLLLFSPLSLVMVPHLDVDSRSQGSSQGQGEAAAADILLVGNSYTQSNNLVSLLSQVISANEAANTSELSGGGMRFDQHANRMNTTGDQWDTTLQNTDLDWVMLQDQSQVPGFPRTSQYWQDSLAGLDDLTARVEQVGGESVLFMTWGYREGDSSNTWRYPDYKTMQHHLRDGYVDYRDNTSNALRTVWIAPVGLAYEHIYDEIVSSGGNPLTSSSLFWNLYSGDGAHPSLTGSYLTACVMYATIYGNNTAGNSDGVSIDATTKLALQQAADATVFNETPGILSYPWMAANWSGPGDGASEEGNSSGNETGNTTTTSPYLSFGANPNSSFSVEPGTAFRLTVNLSNNASFDDNVSVSLVGVDGWNYSFNSPLNFSVGKASLEWVDFTIQVPEVVNGSPLAGIHHHWSLSAESLTTNHSTWWNFSIEVKPRHEIAIIASGEQLTLAPNSDGRIQITIKNIGNTPTRAAVTLQVLLNGTADTNYPPAERIEAYGWTIALFNNYELDWVDVGEETTFEVGLLSPSEVAGDIAIEVKVRNVWGVERAKSTVISGEIEWLRNGSISAGDFACYRTDPGESCIGEIAVVNTGNYDDSFVLELVTSPEWIPNAIQSSEVSVSLGGTSTATTYELEINSTAIAFSKGMVVYQLRLQDSQTIVDTLSIDIEVAAVPDWEIFEITQDAQNGRLSVQYVISNYGNGLDGITVVMEVSHSPEQGLIPPEDAEYEGELIGLHSFSQNNITIGERYTFRAWTDIPVGEPENGTIWLNMTMRSTLEPNIFLFHSANATFIGLPYQTHATDEGFTIGWEEIRSSVVNIWNSYAYTLMAMIIAGISIHLALKRRLKLNREERELEAKKVANRIQENPEDWLQRFEDGGEIPVVLPASPEVSKEAFVADFRNIRGKPSPSSEPVEKELFGAAATVLDHHDGERMSGVLEDVSELIDEHVVTPHPANRALSASEVGIGRTDRKDPRGLVDKSENVPLPGAESHTVNDLDEELDL